MDMVDSYFNFISEYIRLMKKKYDVAEDYCGPREHLFMEYDYLTGSDDPVYYIGGREKPEDIYSGNELKSRISESEYEMRKLDDEYDSKLQEVQDEIQNLYDDYIKHSMINYPYGNVTKQEVEENYPKLKQYLKYDVEHSELLIKDSIYEKMNISDEDVNNFFNFYNSTYLLESYQYALEAISSIESMLANNEHNFFGEDIEELYRNCSIHNLYPEV